MNCPSCAHENRAGAKFCEQCATPLPVVCGTCGAELRPTAKFCDACGAPVGAGAPAAATATAPSPAAEVGARKVVTILFADLAGSTALHERLDPESARRFMEAYYAAARAAVESHGGRVTQLLGDGVKAVFGVPRVAEDDALRAVRAAVAMQASFRALADAQRAAIGETGLRVAVNTGEVVAQGQTEIIGDPVNVAARLQEQGRDGDVVIGESTEQLVGTKVTLELLGSFRLKGRSEQVKAYRVVSLDAPDAGVAAGFVGREQELARITGVYETAVARPAASLAVVLGSAGLGKSRLIEEFERHVGEDATIVHADCDEAGGASFAPLADALRERFGLDADAEPEVVRAAIATALPDDDERARVVAGIEALLAARPAAPEETFFVVRRLLVGLAAHAPVVLVIDDLQWAEPLLLDLVEHLLEWGSGVPLLLLIGARPELRDVRASLTQPGGLVSDVLTLSGLDASAATRLAANVIGASDLPAAVAAKVLAASEGNPLFVGELVRMLVHEGALTKEGDRWTTGTALAALEMPPTIQALLASRIERLDPAERAVLEHASVVGRTFSRSAVAELMPGDGTGLDAQLEALQRSELIERDSGWFLGEPVLRFHHVLIRDAAYARILKGRRADLHARFGDWVEGRAGDALEHDETIGWHFEQAHVYLGELGPLDDAARALGERASRRLAAAGRRALERDDVPLAASLLGRALARLDPDDAARAELALDWCEALLAAGSVGPAVEAIAELQRCSGDSQRLRAWHTCFRGQHTVLTAPEALDATAEAVAAAATTLATHDDTAGEAKAHYVHALALQRLGRVGACEAALDRALAAARRIDDRRRANTVLAIAPLAALWGPSTVTRASGRCLDVVRVLRITQGAPAVEAVALSCQGVLEALRGRTDAARRMIASAREMVEELGITNRLHEADVFAGRVALLEGDATEAERWLRPAYEGLRDAGLGIDAAQAAALLARALLAQDRVDEAESLSHESEALAGDDLAAAIAWRGVRAEALARRGEPAGAVELASKAVEIAAATDALLDHAEARLALAAALRAAGRAPEADAEEARANELWRAKGATLLAEASVSATEPAVSESAASEQSAPSFARRRVRPNRATAAFEAFGAAMDARDEPEVLAWFSDDSVTVEHATGVTLGGPDQRRNWSGILRGTEHRHGVELVASLGESLALAHQRLSLSRFRGRDYESFGETEIEKMIVLEQHPTRPQRLEIYDVDQLGPALARMYELYAEAQPEGPERTRAAETARSVAEFLGDFDFARFPRFAPDVEVADHRTIGLGSFRGAQRLAESVQAILGLTEVWELSVVDVLAQTERALLVHWLNSGIDRSSGGRFERPLLELWVFDERGLLARWERFEPEREVEALARFEALTGGGAPATIDARFENHATRLCQAVVETLRRNDWTGLERLLAEDLRLHDRRRIAQVELDRDAMLTMTSSVMDRMQSRNVSATVLGTLGSRLALWRLNVEIAGGDVGPSDISQLVVVGTDAAGQRAVTWSRFDLDDRVAASAELEARFEADEAAADPRAWATARGFVRAVAASDWERIAELCADDIVERDHRSFATLGTTRGGAAWARNFSALAEEAPDTAYEVDHFRPAERGFLTVGGWRGTRQGGPYEIPLHAVIELAADGKIRSADIYDDVDAALARFAELADPDRPAAPLANAAARADAALFQAFNARDWAGVEALAAPELVFDERRRMVRNTCGRDVWLEQFRIMFDLPRSRFESRLLATRGERLALNIHHFAGDVAGGGGPLEMDGHPCIHEIDAEGRIVAIVLFDIEELDAAYAELDARWQRGEARAHPLAARWLAGLQRGFAQRDWDALAALAAPDLIAHNHRIVGWGERRGPAEWVPVLQQIVELSPDVALYVEHVRTCERALLLTGRYLGTREGGAFETPLAGVIELDPDGRMHHQDIWDGDAVDAALERFEEIARSEPRAVAQSNLATAAAEQFQRAYETGVASGDWSGVGEIARPDCSFQDRRRFSQVTGGYDLMLASLQERAESGARLERTTLGLAGDRVAVQRWLWSGGPADGRFEIEYLGVLETDPSGAMVHAVLIDPDEANAAQREAWSRWAAIDPDVPGWVGVAGVIDALNARDRDAARAFYADDVLIVDHQRTGIGRIEGADALLDALWTYWQVAPDTRFELGWTVHAWGRHGAVFTTRRTGTVPDGGEFEAEYHEVVMVKDGRIVHEELFELEMLDRALARFEELGAER